MHHYERVAPKVSKFRPSLTLELKRLAERRRRRGLPVYDFGLGETKGELAPRIAAAARDAYRDGRTMYGDPAGLAELRVAVLAWLGLEGLYTPDEVTITCGAKQALLNVFLALCSPGDCVLFDAAPWVSYQPLAVAASTLPLTVAPAAGAANRLKVDASDLRRELARRPYARLFLLNSPCNPTAQIYDAGELAALAAVCVEHRVYLVLDRLYWRLVYDGDYPEPPLDEETRRWLIQIDGLSKNFRRTGGLRIGWSVAPADVAAAMVNLQSHYTSGPSMPAQHAAVAAIGAPYDGEMRDALRSNRDLIAERAATLPHVEVWPSPAAFYTFWDVSGCFGRRTPEGELLGGSEEVAAYLLDAAGVVTAAGSAFLQEGYLRLSFAVSEDELLAGLEAASKALAALT